MAQASMTLYGIADAGFQHLSSASGANQGIASGGTSGNRWGLKDTENLGAGWQALVRLESGFSLVNGKAAQGGREFGRQAFVGLTHRDWGSVLLGRTYDPLVDMTTVLTAEGIGGSTPFATPGDVDNNDGSMRISNAVKYISPSFAGLNAQALYDFSGLPGHAGQGSTVSIGLSYAYGPLRLAGGYMQASNAGAASTRSGWGGPSADALFDGASINAGYASAHTLSITQLALQYLRGPFTVGAGYSRASYRPDAASSFNVTETYSTGRVYGFYRASPKWQWGAGYIRTQASGDSSATYHQFSLGGYYSLSVRTNLYVSAAWQLASGLQRLPDGSLSRARAAIASYGIDGARAQTLVMAGVRHTF